MAFSFFVALKKIARRYGTFASLSIVQSCPTGLINSSLPPPPFKKHFLKKYTNCKLMIDKSSVVRVNSYTKDKIKTLSKKKGLTQGELILKALEVAEKMNFEYDLPLDKIAKNQVKESNRIIGFLKQQDKNMLQLEKNIQHFYEHKITLSRRDEFDKFYALMHHNKEEVLNSRREIYRKLVERKKVKEICEVFMHDNFEKSLKYIEQGKF